MLQRNSKEDVSWSLGISKAHIITALSSHSYVALSRKPCIVMSAKTKNFSDTFVGMFQVLYNQFIGMRELIASLI